MPNITATSASIAKRGTKLYLDLNQNDEADTLPRLVPQRHITFRWFSSAVMEKINSKFDPKSYTIRTIGGRLEKRGDVFADVLLKKNANTIREFSDHCFKAVNRVIPSS